ncbi:MAG: hypothetical protein UC662_09745 [Paraprevotella clara]|nr:hypothetical protein [Paraprevotella clara]
MAISNGRTICKTERDLVLQGFKEQLQILENSQIEQENLFKARLYDIISDGFLSNEEKSTEKGSWANELQKLEERHIRIRRSVFIGLYSLWETSLMDIVTTHIPSAVDAARNSKKSNNFSASDYLKLIYREGLPSFVDLIDNNIREFRNYMVHGALTKRRESLIDYLIGTHAKFSITKVGMEYFISDYAGLFEFLNAFSCELDNAENQIIKNINRK